MNSKFPVFEKFDSEINFKAKEKNTFKLRLYAFPFVIFFIFLLLFVRLFQLTIVKGSYYRYISEKNRIREVLTQAPRGKVLDRNGYTLSYSVEQDEKQKRYYNEPLAMAHLIGYQQLASEEEITKDACPEKLRIGDKIGKSGIEKIYECLLRGKKGKKMIEINAQGKYLNTLSIQPPIEGDTITTSIDLELQKKAYDLIKDQKGSVIVTQPDTAEVLAIVSAPTFNPEDFENNNDAKITQYFKDPEQPMFDRVDRGVYPPGSVLKPMLAAGALEDKLISRNFQIEDTGFIKAGETSFGNWYYIEHGKTEGSVDVVKALKRSNDIFFYRLGERLGEKGMTKWANAFGFGRKTGMPLGDADGLIPSSFWKREHIKEPWYLGDTYNLSIGQGYMQATPLQVNLATLPFANGGNYCKPKLLKIDNDYAPECKKMKLSAETLQIIREGMKQACQTGGTGWPLFDFKVKDKSIPIGCKTGTAESHAKSGKPHAWFTAFAPFDKPEIAVTVMIEEGGQGSDAAAPIAREIFKTYFGRQQ
ncbi:MAG TPA: penicillin-binding transpeptidase domain-containing protein [Candidatus Nitrosocosmicus sp.]|nr:penicillin-binding transpeptidase domain-containing protein [Candidatus Nitrosocosmicus sp.]